MNTRTITTTLILLCLACSAARADEPAHPRIEWAFQSDGPIRSSAVIEGDYLYFGSTDGFVYALAKRDGTLRWKHAVGSPIVASPAVATGLVVVASRGRDVLALDETNGQVQWSFRTQPALPATLEWSYFTAAPVVSGDEVFAGSADGHLYALDVASGQLRWQFATSGRIYAAPLVTDDFVYLASGDDCVYALSRKDGSLRWKYATAGTGYDLSQGFTRTGIFTQPALSHGMLVFGSRDANVYALDAATGAKRWTFSYDTTWAMSVAVRERTVFVGWSTNDKINALDLTSGKQLWEFDAGSHTYTRALLRGDNACWGSADGSVYCLDAKNGSLRWRYGTGSEIESSLIEDGGRFYFGTDDGRLLALLPDAPVPVKAVYLPAAIPANLQGFVIDPALQPYFVGKGYAHLDSPAALAQWISAQTAAGSPSVVVFGFAQIPSAILGENPANGPLRRYLESGGKVVWPGGIPNHYMFDDQGTLMSADPAVGEKLLDLKFIPFEDSGNYYSRATQAGRNWGMSSWLRICFSYVASDSNLTALASDEFGRVSAFVRKFHPRSGSGWVSYGAKGFGVPITDIELAMLARVAAYGID